jgi:hypothetical protein
MNFLEKKLQDDFMDCVRLDKAILLGQVSKDQGTMMLFDLIDYVKQDIATLDEKSWDILQDAEKEILEEVAIKKDQIEMDRKTKDAGERREKEMRLLREDYLACKVILQFCQQLCYQKGWFQ